MNFAIKGLTFSVVAALSLVGCGKQEPGWAKQVLEARDRKLAGVTAPADGLYLGGVLYPERFGMTRHPIFDLLPPDARRYVPPVPGEDE